MPFADVSAVSWILGKVAFTGKCVVHRWPWSAAETEAAGWRRCWSSQPLPMPVLSWLTWRWKFSGKKMLKGGQRNSTDILGRRNKPVKRENCLPTDYFVLQIQIHSLYFWGETIFLYFKGSQTPDIPAGINWEIIITKITNICLSQVWSKRFTCINSFNPPVGTTIPLCSNPIVYNPGYHCWHCLWELQENGTHWSSATLQPCPCYSGRDITYPALAFYWWRN